MNNVFMVLREGTKTEKVYASKTSAKVEARRLAGLYPKDKIYVLKAVEYYQTESPPIKRVSMETDKKRDEGYDFTVHCSNPYWKPSDE